MVERLDYSPHGARRVLLAAATFRFSRAAWRARFHTNLRAHRVLSGRLTKRLADLDARFDLALQIHGWVGGQPIPYALFVDQTRLMAERGWPAWLPLARTERSTLLELEREMYRRAMHVFSMGAPARDSLLEDYGVEADRVSVVGGGINFDPLPPLSGPGSEPSVLFVGREFERKGGAVLLEAFELVRQELPEARLHLVGIADRSQTPGVIAHGLVSDRARLAELYREARVFCLPSLYEPFGLALIEAMSHGVPCVGAAVQSIPEILAEGRAGLLVPPNEPEPLAAAVLRLLSDQALARSVGVAGRRRVEREYTWGRVAERMAPVISRVRSSQ